MIKTQKINAEVFKDTRFKSKTTYKNDTDELLKHTQIYSNADKSIPDYDMLFRDKMEIKVISGGTVSTAYNLKTDDCRVAMLNFADAKRPGGWVKEGATTQEENMCRCTNLYETLTQKKCLKNYYDVNFKFGIKDAENHYVEPYTDTLIYSENVAIFKDDVQYNDVPVKYVDVITCPAPCGNVIGVEKILENRMKCIVKAAYLHNVTHLVLGAWGCGAFGQNPKVVAQKFKDVLYRYIVFDTVVFAVRSCGVDYFNRTLDNYTVFKEIFNG